MRGAAIDPRYGCAGSEPAVLDVPEGSTVRETARGLAVTRPDGAVTYFTTRPPAGSSRRGGSTRSRPRSAFRPAESLVLVRRNVVAEGVVGAEVRRAGGTGSAGVDP